MRIVTPLNNIFPIVTKVSIDTYNFDRPLLKKLIYKYLKNKEYYIHLDVQIDNYLQYIGIFQILEMENMTLKEILQQFENNCWHNKTPH